MSQFETVGDVPPCPFCGVAPIYNAEYGEYSCNDRNCPGWHVSETPDRWSRRIAPAISQHTEEQPKTKPCPACSAPLIVCDRCEGYGDEPHTDNDVTGPACCKECNGLGGKYFKSERT